MPGSHSSTPFRRIHSDAKWEPIVGYCRVVVAGDRAFVTGTAPVNEGGEGVFAPGDAYAQARCCLERIQKSLAEAGIPMDRVVRTRLFVTDISRWQEYGRAHAEFFADHPPATTMVEVQRLIEPEMLIEIEADAVL